MRQHRIGAVAAARVLWGMRVDQCEDVIAARSSSSFPDGDSRKEFQSTAQSI